MPKLEQEGNYNVTITSAQYKEAPRANDEGAFKILMKGETEDGLFAWAEMDCSNYTFQSGKFEGKTAFYRAVDTLKQLGVEDGNPGMLAEAIEKGLQANFALKWNEWTNKQGELKRYLEVAFINPIKNTIDVKDVDWSEKIAKLRGETPAPKEPIPSELDAVTPPPASDAKGDLPF